MSTSWKGAIFLCRRSSSEPSLWRQACAHVHAHARACAHTCKSPWVLCRAPPDVQCSYCLRGEHPMSLLENQSPAPPALHWMGGTISQWTSWLCSHLIFPEDLTLRTSGEPVSVHVCACVCAHSFHLHVPTYQRTFSPSLMTTQEITFSPIKSRIRTENNILTGEERKQSFSLENSKGLVFLILLLFCCRCFFIHSRMRHVLTHTNRYYAFGRFVPSQGAVFPEGWEILIVNLLTSPSDVWY